MSKPFTEMPVSPKRRLIIQMHTTSELDPILCESCESSRADFADPRPLAPMCDVCGMLLCWACFGADKTISGTDLKQYHICDSCTGMRIEEIDEVLEMRARFPR